MLHAILKAQKNILARLAITEEYNKNIAEIPLTIRFMSAGFPKLVPAVFIPVIVIFFDTTIIQGWYAAMYNSTTPKIPTHLLYFMFPLSCSKNND